MTNLPEDDEAARLDAVATVYSSYEGFEHKLVQYGYKSIEPYFVGTSCLELGPADGSMTDMLLERFEDLTSVEGSAAFCDALRARINKESYTVICSLFEDFETDKQFETVVAAHVLEHVEDPLAILQRAHQWLASNGRLVVQVPNSRSIHRMLGVHMGVIESLDSLSERDILVGHRRVYDAEALRKHLNEAGWKVEAIVGSYFKVFSNEQSEKWFTPEMTEAFFHLGQDFPENGTMIAAICRK